MNTLTLDGREYAVSPQWAAAVINSLGTLEFTAAAVESDRQTLLLISNNRALAPREKSRLEFLTHVKNVANTIRVVGAHHDPVKEWGFDGWDAVHGNYLHLPECSCVKHYVFDHHSATNHFGHNRVNKDRKHHEIEPRRLCAAHGG